MATRRTSSGEKPTSLTRFLTAMETEPAEEKSSPAIPKRRTNSSGVSRGVKLSHLRLLSSSPLVRG